MSVNDNEKFGQQPTEFDVPTVEQAAPQTVQAIGATATPSVIVANMRSESPRGDVFNIGT